MLGSGLREIRVNTDKKPFKLVLNFIFRGTDRRTRHYYMGARKLSHFFVEYVPNRIGVSNCTTFAADKL